MQLFCLNRSEMLQSLIFVAVIACIHSATIGDGQTSLISGRAVDYRLGSCNIDGRNYASETSVPRDHPCHYCICFAGKIECYWKQCGNIPDGCQVMAFEETCNPSLYVCTIDERARDEPLATRTDRKTVPVAQDPAVSIPTPITTLSRAPVDVITEPADYLLPPPLPLALQNRPSLQRGRSKGNVIRQVDSYPSQFGLRMRQKMRFRRDVSTQLRNTLPFSIEEPFPLQFDRDFVVQLDRQIRSRRSINASAAHNHHQPVDRGCTILGVRYHLGDVVGIATDVCQECRCAAQSLYCSPKCCFKAAAFQINEQVIRSYEDTPAVNPNDPAVQHPLHFVQSEFS